jgi:hypothetical protein
LNRAVLSRLQYRERESCRDGAQIHARLRAIYDADRRLVPCAVTGRALAAAALAYSLEKTDPLLVYRTFKARIRAAAREK